MSKSSVKDSDYKCTLCEATLDKAKKELGETPDTRMLEVKQLRARLDKVPGLQPRTDFEFLLAFLRARKFDQEKAFQLIRRHYQEKYERAEHYDDIKPSKVKHVIDSNMMEVLEHRNKDGCRVLVIRPGRWDPDRYHVDDAIKLLFLILFKLAKEEETQVHGIHVIDLLDTITLNHAVHVKPGMAKLLASTLQDMVPLRLKRYDMVKEPVFFSTFFPIFKSFMKDKLVQRIRLNGDNFDEIHKLIPPEHLPTDLGGKLENFSYNKIWFSNLLAEDKDFEDNNKFGFVSMALQNNKSETKKADAGLQGLGGTFKKLDI